MPPRFRLANAIRTLSMDAVQKANSGHPGMPMGMADIAEVLWNDFLSHNPSNPHWSNRDRFILSNGHGCMLQYALLHLTGYDLSIEDIKQFRQLHSKTPGHPEYGITAGVETTTGPLGQGLANAVGMALAEQLLAAEFNREQHSIINHYTYCFVGDGCLMEGISHEVASLAGTLGLGKLIVFWDDNGISIDGFVKDWFSDDTPKRFEAYDWHVIRDIDGHNPEQIHQAIAAAQNETQKPTLICCKTIIGFGANSLAGTAKIHGTPLGEKEITAARQTLQWPYAPFEIPNDIYAAWNAKEKGKQREETWTENFQAYEKAYPELARELLRRLQGKLPAEFEKNYEQFIYKTQENLDNIATRKASQNALDVLVQNIPELFGGSADLSESNLTLCQASRAISPQQFLGNYLYYGVREFGMSAMMNGLALYKGLIPYAGTFLTFMDYARNAVRLAALMQQRVIFVYTHDSVGLGEDGPTHQPIEHLTLLRATPNMSLWRPCDATETAVAWKMAITRSNGPTSLALSRQNLKHQLRNSEQITAISRGGYILKESVNPLKVLIIATGSEVNLAVEAAELLEKEGLGIRVVSLPCWDVFEQQDIAYRDSVLPPHIKTRVAIEAGSTLPWYRWVGLEGAVVGIDRFGESAPAAKAFSALGITTEALIQAVHQLHLDWKRPIVHPETVI
jgi:transketolase